MMQKQVVPGHNVTANTPLHSCLEFNIATHAVGAEGPVDLEYCVVGSVLQTEGRVDHAPLLLHGTDYGARRRVHLK
jgi:hypothetical protein